MPAAPQYGLTAVECIHSKGFDSIPLTFGLQCRIGMGKRHDTIARVESGAEVAHELLCVGDTELHAVYVDEHETVCAGIIAAEKYISLGKVLHKNAGTVQAVHICGQRPDKRGKIGEVFDAAELAPVLEVAAYVIRAAQTSALAEGDGANRLGSVESEGTQLLGVVKSLQGLGLAEKTVDDAFDNAGYSESLDAQRSFGTIINDGNLVAAAVYDARTGRQAVGGELSGKRPCAGEVSVYA